MPSFLPSSKKTPQSDSTKSTMANRTHSGLNREANPTFRIESPSANKKIEQSLDTSLEEIDDGSMIALSTPGRTNHNFASIPTNTGRYDQSPRPTQYLGVYHSITPVSNRFNKMLTPAIQTKLSVGSAGDKFEREADQVADEVVTMPQSCLVPDVTTYNKAESIQTKQSPAVDFSSASAITQPNHDRLRKHNGKSLSAATLAFMEPRFGRDFSHVRVHTDREAAVMNQNLNARAFTYGSDIYFKQGQYNPTSSDGKKLLAHELTHVLQQSQLFVGVPPVNVSKINPLIQRDIDFEQVALERYTVVDPKTGDTRKSDFVVREFLNGLKRWLALTPNALKENSLTAVEKDTTREAEIRKQFEDAFIADGIEMLQDTKDSDGNWTQKRTKITFETAWKKWEEVRDAVENRIGSYTGDVAVKESDGEAPVASDGSNILINPKFLEGFTISADVNESFDGFWFLVHELMHLESGLDDPVVNTRRFGQPVTIVLNNKNPSRTRVQGETGVADSGSKLIGDAVSKLNVLRFGFGLPIRTSYINNTGDIRFSKEGAIGAAESERFKQGKDIRRVEFVGAVTDPEKAQSLVLFDPYIDFWLRDSFMNKITDMWTIEGDEEVKSGPIKFAQIKRHSFEAAYRYEDGAEGQLTGDLIVQAATSPGKLPGLDIRFWWWQGKASGRGLWNISSEESEKGGVVTVIGPWWYGDEATGKDGFWAVDISIPDKAQLNSALKDKNEMSI